MSNTDHVKTPEEEAIAAECDKLNKEYLGLVGQIPWASLDKLPEKLGPVGKMFGFKPDDISIKKPIEDILGFVKTMVMDLNKLRRRNGELEKRLKKLEG